MSASTPPPSRRSAPERFNELLRERLFGEAPHIGFIRICDDLIHYAVALVLLTVAGIALYRTAYDLATTSQPFAAAATIAVNGVLFAIIVLEVMRTVIAHFERGGLQLQPFLIIGIISAVREILTVGARLSLQGSVHEPSPSIVRDALLELAVNAAVVLGLALSLCADPASSRHDRRADAFLSRSFADASNLPPATGDRCSILARTVRVDSGRVVDARTRVASNCSPCRTRPPGKGITSDACSVLPLRTNRGSVRSAVVQRPATTSFGLKSPSIADTNVNRSATRDRETTEASEESPAGARARAGCDRCWADAPPGLAYCRRRRYYALSCSWDRLWDRNGPKRDAESRRLTFCQATKRPMQTRRIPRKCGNPALSAEREGFEPSMDETAHTGFRDRRIQPLCHLSGGRNTLDDGALAPVADRAPISDASRRRRAATRRTPRRGGRIAPGGDG